MLNRLIVKGTGRCVSRLAILIAATDQLESYACIADGSSLNNPVVFQAILKKEDVLVEPIKDYEHITQDILTALDSFKGYCEFKESPIAAQPTPLQKAQRIIRSEAKS